MLLSSRLNPEGSPQEWFDRVTLALELLASRPGYIRGWVGRSPDEPETWLVAAEFDSAGSCRRALSAADLRPVLWPLFGLSGDGAGTFEVLATAAAGQGVERLVSDLAPDAAEVSLGRLPEPDAADRPTST